MPQLMTVCYSPIFRHAEFISASGKRNTSMQVVNSKCEILIPAFAA